MRQPTLLVSAGPSREYLDDVRFISNGSSGRMGIAVAQAAAADGWTVHLALGPTPVSPPAGVSCHSFTSATDLDGVTRELWPTVDAFVATAAVCDYRPATRAQGKRKKTAEDWALTLVRTPDILAERAHDKGRRVLVGFALEEKLDAREALRKLEEKHLDLILLNTIDNLGSNQGDFDWIEAGSAPRQLRSVSKEELGERIVEFVAKTYRSRLRPPPG